MGNSGGTMLLAQQSTIKQGLNFVFHPVQLLPTTSGDFIAAFWYLKGGHYRKAGKGIFMGECSDRTKGNGFR